MKVYLTKNGKPSWAPLTVLTQHGETKDFLAHIYYWQHIDLHLAAKADQLTLPKKKQTIRYPAIGKLKVGIVITTLCGLPRALLNFTLDLAAERKYKIIVAFGQIGKVQFCRYLPCRIQISALANCVFMDGIPHRR